MAARRNGTFFEQCPERCPYPCNIETGDVSNISFHTVWMLVRLRKMRGMVYDIAYSPNPKNGTPENFWNNFEVGTVM